MSVSLRGADFTLRGSPLAKEWGQIWNRFRRVAVDLFASQANTHCPLWFSLTLQDDPPPGVDAFAQKEAALHLSSSPSHSPFAGESETS